MYVEQTFATDLLPTGAAGLGYPLEERVGRVEAFLVALRRIADGGTAIDPRSWSSCSPGLPGTGGQ